ncbi:RND family efflux transporter MFP subunit [Shimia isoporae]|uniref:RND family efflux transporter MFP subunit n=1 Tax=Shimia isoporae TaxID=647720 RepID=A0A4R1NP05_9RHOB|nr:efflux RND transporter periplasmic adaptor subunit [Shimia isoporae]TCL09559.1 RND family efflux transporter MFP subunit [Shimia isoporae]
MQLLTAILSFGTALFLSNQVTAQENDAPPRPAKVHVVTAQESVLSRSYPAVAFPSREVALSFRVGGRVVDLPIRASQAVKAGDLIAQLDTRDFEADVSQLEARLDEAEAQLQILKTGARPEEIAALKAAVQAASVQLEQARDEYERTKQLVERGVVAATVVEQQEAAVRVAEAELVSRNEQLTIGLIGGRPEEVLAAEAGIRGLKAQLQAARDTLSDATLRAPFDGVIARRSIEAFSNVQAGADIALLQNIKTLEVGFDLPGADIVAMANKGFDLFENAVTFDALPDLELPADLVEFATQADTATQTYRGRLLVTLPDGAVVLPGMVARVHIRGSSYEAAVVSVPQSALAAAPDGSTFVWKVDANSNAVTSAPVTVSDVTESGTIVTSGLSAGDVVVSAGIGDLQDGTIIRPIQKVGE